MLSPRATMARNLNPNFNEFRWVMQIRRSLDEEVEDDTETPVCIFNVPKTLISSKPHSYIPQQVSLGPYHYWRPELSEMARYKLVASKRIQNQLQSLKFHDIVNHLTKLELRIRAYYHKCIDLNGETLAWMMAIDASFMLEFLQMYVINDNRVAMEVSSRMSHIIDYAGRKSAHNTILRDIMMLENQIPLFLLTEMLEFQYPSLEIVGDVLNSMLTGLFKELSPLKMMKDFPIIQATKYAHLLDFFYQMIVPKLEEPCGTNKDCLIVPILEERLDINETDKQSYSIEETEGLSKDSGYIREIFKQIWELLLKLNKGLVRNVNYTLALRPIKLLMKLPWTIIIHMPVFAILRQSIGKIFPTEDKTDAKLENNGENVSTNDNKPPMIEEIMIPSVTELHELGVRFSPTKGGITTISFDEKTITLYLPTVSLDVHTEVIVRNLLAYEASTASGPLVFTRYIELMDGLIDTEGDAKLLRESGIVLNHLKSDREVANLWNGMSQLVKLSKVPFLDKVIEDVNKYYGGHWKVKVGKLMKSYVFGSWKFLTFLAAIFLLVLTSLQAFCSVYGCSITNVGTIK